MVIILPTPWPFQANPLLIVHIEQGGLLVVVTNWLLGRPEVKGLLADDMLIPTIAIASTC